jgi:hypothetical protein
MLLAVVSEQIVTTVVLVVRAAVVAVAVRLQLQEAQELQDKEIMVVLDAMVETTLVEEEVLVAQEQTHLLQVLVPAAMAPYQPFQVHLPLTLVAVVVEVNLEELQQGLLVLEVQAPAFLVQYLQRLLQREQMLTPIVVAVVAVAVEGRLAVVLEEKVS